MKQARIEWQGQVRDVLVDERDQVRLTMARY
jgi:5-oxopent-3-ene-1,2,5-tricarboxylate decarboxylase/2-hydroxyhepta-2,4-diene-1,7-dioate isomerase